MPDFKLHFQTPRILTELYCGDFSLLEEVEKAFSLKVVSRDDWVQLEGDDDSLLKGEKFFRTLESARNQGMTIKKGDFRNILRDLAANNEEELKQLFDDPLVIHLKKKSIVPKTLNQKKFLLAMQSREVTFGIGPAGTGKTYLAVATALQSLMEGKVERIILTRPAVEAGEALGFLPGDLTEKIQPYLLPLYDAIYDMLGQADGKRILGMDADKKEDRHSKIEIAPLAYMRGRTLSNAFVILDEAQNTTPEQMMMFLTRLGEGSRMVVTGDKTQIDLPRHKYSGLKEAEKVLSKVKGISFHFFEGKDVVRNQLVQKIINAYAEYGEKTGAHQPREVDPN